MKDQSDDVPEIQPHYTGPLDGDKIARLADELLSLSVLETATLRKLMEDLVQRSTVFAP